MLKITKELKKDVKNASDTLIRDNKGNFKLEIKPEWRSDRIITYTSELREYTPNYTYACYIDYMNNTGKIIALLPTGGYIDFRFSDNDGTSDILREAGIRGGRIYLKYYNKEKHFQYELLIGSTHEKTTTIVPLIEF